MPQLVQKYQNHNERSRAYNKWYVQAVYPVKFITTTQLADFIQSQASVKRSDCKAVLDELGSALQHFLGLGQKVKIDNVGIFKVGLSSVGTATEETCTAANVTKSRVLFQPETESVLKESHIHPTRGTVVNVYYHRPTMLSDVTFELTQNQVNDASQPQPEP